MPGLPDDQTFLDARGWHSRGPVPRQHIPYQPLDQTRWIIHQELKIFSAFPEHITFLLHPAWDLLMSNANRVIYQHADITSRIDDFVSVPKTRFSRELRVPGGGKKRD